MAKRNSILLVLFGVVCLVLIHSYSLDGIHGWIFSALEKDDTVFAEGYSDRMFRKIKKGDRAQEVFSMIGKPLQARKYKDGRWEHVTYDAAYSNTNGVVQCSWTRSTAGGSYHIRRIGLTGGIVSSKHSEYYLD